MTDDQFRNILALMMVSDPWPLTHTHQMQMEAWADEEARKRGYYDWLEAYMDL